MFRSNLPRIQWMILLLSVMLLSCNQESPVDSPPNTENPATKVFQLLEITALSNHSVRMRFNRDLTEEARDITQYRISQPSASDAASDSSSDIRVLAVYLEADKRSLILATDEQTDTNYQITIRNLSSSHGERINNQRSNFKGVQAASPVVASATALSSTRVVITLMDPEKGTPAVISSEGLHKQWVEIEGLEVIELKHLGASSPSSQLMVRTSPQAAQKYTLKITNIKDSQGRLVDPTANSTEFAGISADDTKAPTLEDVTLINDTSLRLRFSEGMKTDLLTDVKNYSIKDKNGQPLNIIEVRQGTTSQEVLVTMLKISEGMLYELVLSNLQDESGNLLDSNANRRYFGSNLRDSDSDGLPDEQEINGVLLSDGSYVILDPLDADTDDDGRSDGDEVRVACTVQLEPATEAFSNPARPDSDDDGYSDSHECGITKTNPAAADTDGDKLTDYEELEGVKLPNDESIKLDPFVADADNDGRLDGEEVKEPCMVRLFPTFPSFSHPTIADADSDGLNDGLECQNGTNPSKADTDGDTLNDKQEIEGWQVQVVGSDVYTAVSNPTRQDSDQDGLSDFEEFNGCLDEDKNLVCDPNPDDASKPLYSFGQTDPSKEDSDEDGLVDKQEVTGVELRNADGEPNDTFVRLDPLTNDSDSDGLADGAEIKGVRLANGQFAFLDPQKADTDDDGIKDGDEISIPCKVGLTTVEGATISFTPFEVYTDPRSADPDNDGLPDGVECSTDNNYTTNPNRADTDGDQLSDKEEVEGVSFRYGKQDVANPPPLITVQTNPLNADSDDDGRTDKQEITVVCTVGLEEPSNFDYRTHPLKADEDNDDLKDKQECELTSHPNDANTDGDDLSDKEEVVGWEVKIVGQAVRNVQSSPVRQDADNDGLSDLEERNLATDPNLKDSDADGLSDGIESKPIVLNNHEGTPKVTLSPTNPDTDNDGRSDGAEVNDGCKIMATDIYTDPTKADVDEDGLNDGQECGFGSNPKIVDTDGDKLTDKQEFDGWDVTIVGRGTTRIQSNPAKADADEDGLTDFEEARGCIDNAPQGSCDAYNFGPTHPKKADSDEDGMNDKDEVIYNAPLNTTWNRAAIIPRDWDSDGEIDYAFNPVSSDSDGDGLNDVRELEGIRVSLFGRQETLYPHPQQKDTDGDGLNDGQELSTGFYLKIGNAETIQVFTDSNNADTDGDGITDFAEVNGVTLHDANGNVIEAQAILNPTSRDSDGDGRDDNLETDISKACIALIVNYQGDNLETLKGMSDPRFADTDGDKLNDKEECDEHKTLPNNADTDGEGLTDYEEVITYKSNPLNVDSSGDGVNDYDEVVKYRQDPSNPDGDNDGLDDYLEVKQYGSDPQNPDTDGDTLKDGEEVNSYGSDPTKQDTDDDGLRDDLEVALGTKLDDKDTDGDGLEDGEEVNTHYTSPTKKDTDGDGLEDNEEVNGVNIDGIGIVKTNPTNVDTDDDGTNDGDEAKGVKVMIFDGTGTARENVREVTYTSNPTKKDTDGDGLEDQSEYLGNVYGGYKSNPSKRDTDDDGTNDGDEVNGVTIGGSPTYHSNPVDKDTDGDGLEDQAEYLTVNGYTTNPENVDTDDDGTNDRDEVKGVKVTIFNGTGTARENVREVTYTSNPTKKDTDGDGLEDQSEYLGNVYGGYKSNPSKRDTDGDGTNDGDEVNGVKIGGSPTYHSNPVDKDTDGDGLEDQAEYLTVNGYTTNPENVDTDGDGLEDNEEVNGVNIDGIGIVKTNPTNVDTDDDGTNDRDEVKGVKVMIFDGTGTDKENLREVTYTSNPTKKDTDGDGLEDQREYLGDVYGGYKSNPSKRDTDGDGTNDGDEVNGVKIGGSPTYHSNPVDKDTDGDGLEDQAEYLTVNGYTTNPENVDTDGDGANNGNRSDSQEIKDGLNPTEKDQFVEILSTVRLIQPAVGGCTGTVTTAIRQGTELELLAIRSSEVKKFEANARVGFDNGVDPFILNENGVILTLSWGLKEGSTDIGKRGDPLTFTYPVPIGSEGDLREVENIDDTGGCGVWEGRLRLKRK